MVTLVVVTLFLRAKGGAKCMDACFTVRTRARAVSVSVGQGITDLFDHMQGPEAVRARRQTRIRRDTVDVNDGTVEHRDNPLEGIEMAALGAEPAIEPTVEFAVEPSRRKFERYETEDGEEFFVQVGTQESVWDLPAGGEVI